MNDFNSMKWFKLQGYINFGFAEVIFRSCFNISHNTQYNKSCGYTKISLLL